MQRHLLILLTILCVFMVTACGADTSAVASTSDVDLDPHKMVGKEASKGGDWACSYMGDTAYGKEECKDEAAKGDLNLSCSLETAELLVTCEATGMAGNWYHWWTGDTSNPNLDVVPKETEGDIVKVDASKSNLDKNTRQPNTDISVTNGTGTFSFKIKAARSDLSINMEECVQSQFGGTTGCRTATTIAESK